MFEKLLSVLPYSPGLVHQMAFYGRRMHEEASIRRTGLVFIVLAFMIQFFAVLSPPQSSVASSSNDMLTGGFSSAAEAKKLCLSGTKHYGTIMHYFGITCKDIGNADDLTIHTGAQNYYSMGWNPVGPTYNGHQTNDTPFNIPGAGTLYARKMDIWNVPAWHVLRVRNSDDRVFYIMFDCGNLVSVGLPAKPAKPVTPPPEETPPPTPTPATPTPPTPPATPPPATPPPATPPPATPPPATPPAVCQYNSSLPADSPLCFQPCQYNALLPATDINCKPCDKSVSPSDTVACISVHKTASNVTTGATDANNTTANPGDVITYTIYAANSGKSAVKNFVFQENLNDVLDYADITDLHGGSLNTDGTAIWPAEDIGANQTASHQITVKVKNPIPQTPASSSDPAHFDLTMTNVYGNSINIKVPASPAKAVEVATTTQLPNTGPGTTLFVAAIIVFIAGYFYSRANLLARESQLAIKEGVSA